MLTYKQIQEIREHLEKAQNPVFFFDNDPDGLCSFLILRRYFGKGKGVAIRSFPDLSQDYFRKVEELNADYIFILDKPIVSKEFFDKVRQKNIPCVWIDHHEVQTEIPSFVSYYNSVLSEEKSGEPVTYLCYKITDKKEDLWLAVVGSISDRFVPDFYKEFEEKYPDLKVEYKDAFDILYKSKVGRISKLFSFGLMDRTTNVVNMLRFLIKVKSLYEVLEEDKNNYLMHKRFEQINSKYQLLLNKAVLLERISRKLLFFQYGGDLSISSELANELNYKFPDKIVAVAYVRGVKANISVRGRNVRDLILKAIEGLEDATGGGHEDAVGAQVRVEDVERFKENLTRLVEEKI